MHCFFFIITIFCLGIEKIQFKKLLERYCENIRDALPAEYCVIFKLEIWNQWNSKVGKLNENPMRSIALIIVLFIDI